MSEEAVSFPDYQRLRVPTNWTVVRNKFFDVEPEHGDLPYDDELKRWTLFEQELLFCAYEKQNLFLTMGWYPDYNPNGKYILFLDTDNDWRNTQTIYETRSRAEIVEAVEQTMLRFSRENGDHGIKGKNVSLQPLRFSSGGGWKIVKNEFFEQLEPSGQTRIEGLPNEDGWQLMTEDLLHLEWFRDVKVQIRLGWFPAHDPSGAFRILATTDKYFDPPLVNYSTRDKTEAIEIVEHLTKEIHHAKPIKK